jgi:hypothetical protein
MPPLEEKAQKEETDATSSAPAQPDAEPDPDAPRVRIKL